MMCITQPKFTADTFMCPSYKNFSQYSFYNFIWCIYICIFDYMFTVYSLEMILVDFCMHMITIIVNTIYSHGPSGQFVAQPA